MRFLVFSAVVVVVFLSLLRPFREVEAYAYAASASQEGDDDDDFSTRGFSVANFSQPPRSGFFRLLNSAQIRPGTGDLLACSATPSSMGQVWVPSSVSSSSSGAAQRRMMRSRQQKPLMSDGNNNGPPSASPPQGLLEVRGFRTKFAFELSGSAGDAGEGIAFVLQGAGDDQYGDLLGGIGYGKKSELGSGVRSSIAVEFDTFKNTELLDPSDNHVSIHTTGGSNPNSANESHSLNSSSVMPLLANKGVHTVEIVYTPPLAAEKRLNLGAQAGLLTVKFDGLGASSVSTDKLLLEHNISLVEGRYAYVGFTGATKPASAFTQRVLNWTFEFLGESSNAESFAFGTGIANATAGKRAEFAVQCVDQFGNNMSTSFQSNVTGALTTQPGIAVTVSYVGNGLFRGHYTPTKASDAGRLALRLNGANIKDSPHAVSIVAGAVAPAECEAFQAQGQTGLAAKGTAGKTREFSVQLRDQYKNDIKAETTATVSALITDTVTKKSKTFSGVEQDPGIFVVSYDREVANPYTIDIKVDGKDIQNPKHSTVIEPGAVKGSACIASGATATAIAGQQQSFSIQIRDEYKNNITTAPSPAPSFDVEVTGSDDSAKGKVSSSAVDGRYEITYVVSVSGAYTISAKVDGEAIEGSPFDANVVPDNTVSPAHSTATGEALKTAVAGVSHFDVQIRDAHSNPITTEHKNLTWAIEQKSVEFNRVTPGFYFNVSYTTKGVYRLSYFQSLAEMFTMNVSINGKAIRESPFELTVAPGPISAPHCTAEGDGLSKSMTNHEAEFTVKSADRYSNPIPKSSGAIVKAVLSLSASDDTFNADVSDKQNGKYDGKYDLKQSGQYSLAITVSDEAIKGSPFTVEVEWEGLNAGEVVGIGLGAAALIGGMLGGFILYRTKCSKRARYQSIREKGGASDTTALL